MVRRQRMEERQQGGGGDDAGILEWHIVRVYCPTIDENPRRGRIVPSLNVGLLARTLSAASHVVEGISGVVSSRCESLKKHVTQPITSPFSPLFLSR